MIIYMRNGEWGWFVGIEVLTAVAVKSSVMPYSPVKINRRFEGTYRLRLLLWLSDSCCFFVGLLFNPKNRDGIFLWNVRWLYRITWLYIPEEWNIFRDCFPTSYIINSFQYRGGTLVPLAQISLWGLWLSIAVTLPFCHCKLESPKSPDLGNLF
jgi:hypothetical protein